MNDKPRIAIVGGMGLAAGLMADLAARGINVEVVDADDVPIAPERTLTLRDGQVIKQYAQPAIPAAVHVSPGRRHRTGPSPAQRMLERQRARRLTDSQGVKQGAAEETSAATPAPGADGAQGDTP